MKRRGNTLGVLLCRAASACGPLLDVNDGFSGRVGPHTAFGSYHRDFWGKQYFVPNGFVAPTSDQAKTSQENQLP
jgi:hypothetical protein